MPDEHHPDDAAGIERLYEQKTQGPELTIRPGAGESAYEAARQSEGYEPDYWPPPWIDLPEAVRHAWDLAQRALDHHMGS